jgi:hypothetical protein
MIAFLLLSKPSASIAARVNSRHRRGRECSALFLRVKYRMSPARDARSACPFQWPDRSAGTFSCAPVMSLTVRGSGRRY